LADSRTTHEPQLRGTSGSGACGVDDCRRSADQLNLARTLEQGLLGHELASARDVAEPGVRPIREEIRRGTHGDQRADAEDADGDDGGAKNDDAL
jgi:hypothetical protein